MDIKDDWYINSLGNTIEELKALVLCGFPFARYSEKCFTQIYRALHGDAMLAPFRGAPTWESGSIFRSNHANWDELVLLYFQFVPSPIPHQYIYIHEWNSIAEF